MDICSGGVPHGREWDRQFACVVYAIYPTFGARKNAVLYTQSSRLISAHRVLPTRWVALNLRSDKVQFFIELLKGGDTHVASH